MRLDRAYRFKAFTFKQCLRDVPETTSYALLKLFCFNGWNPLEKGGKNASRACKR